MEGVRAPGINNIVAKRAYHRRLIPPLAEPSTLPPCRAPLELPDDAFVVENLLAPAECEALLAAAEAVPPDDGGFSFWGADCADADRARRFRSADTLEAFQPELCEQLWARLAPFVPAELRIEPASERFERDLEGTWTPYGLNPHLLFARYAEGGHFAPHVDGQTELDFNTRTLFSVIIYLGSTAEGGATRLLRGEQADATERDGAERADGAGGGGGRLVARADAVRTAVRPVAGRALGFYHQQLHDGEPVGGGCRKDIVRTDVLYRRREPLCTSEKDVRAYELYRRARDAEAAGAHTEAAALFRASFKASETIARMYGG